MLNNILLYLFTILSYTHIIHFTINEAKTQLNDGFSIDLYHRYSPTSPFYNSSMSYRERFHRLVMASASRHSQIKSLQNNIVDTNIMINNGDYLMNISVGSPPVELVAIADTATDLTWFQCLPCANCYGQSTPIFNPALSSTYRTLPCDTEHCFSLDPRHMICDHSLNQCLYWYTYGNMSTVTMGVMGNDTISFSSSDGKQPSFPSTSFGCGHGQAGIFDHESAGVVGLGSGALSLVSQLSSSIDYKFSYCLAIPTSNTASKLRFGRVEKAQQGALTTPFFINSPPSFYNLELTSISIGKLSVQVQKDIIIDTATTLTYLNPSIFSSLETMLNAAIGIQPMFNALVDNVLCYTMISSSGDIILPDIVFHFSGGDLTLNGSNIFFEIDNSFCLSFGPTPEDDDPLIFGNMAQANLEIEFDLLSKIVSFAPKNCANDN